MRAYLDVRGLAGTPAYAAGVAAAYLAQPFYVFAAAAAAGLPLEGGGLVWMLPFRALTQLKGLPPPLLAGGLVVCFAAAAAMVALTLRRMPPERAGWAAAMVILPVLQLAAVLWAAALPAARALSEKQPAPFGQVRATTMVKGVLTGTGLAVFAVALSTLVYGAYGFGLFVISPLLVGFTTGYIANRSEALSVRATAGGVFGAAALGSSFLLFFGLEGGICMLMALPITGPLAIGGGLIGREIAGVRRRRTRPTAISLAALPLLFALDAASPPSVDLLSADAVEIAASPDAVWRTLVEMGDIQPAPALPFRLGLAYPLRAEIVGGGVGAERLGTFSTGVARERITAWEPGRRLAFQVLTSPPAMRELSPYAEVHAPHAEGYFRTAWTSFDLEPTYAGGTKLTLRSRHTLQLGPPAYWEPLARWAIRENGRRVLSHVRARAEAVAAAPPRLKR